ncbi:hypothetical protein ACROYT_G020120 [Oculina patagonica]
MRDSTFYKLEAKALAGNVIATIEGNDHIDCSFLCLEHGPSACLSFNVGRDNNNGYYTCELSNSERHLEPLGIQERPGYDYYGMTTESLFRLLPCTSSPCYYGGTCIHGPRLGEFSCQCGIEVSVLPFIDDVCNVDRNAMTIFKPVEGVFHAKVGQYKLNYYDAKRLCEILGAALATFNQLYAAWKAGHQHCSNAWLADSTVRFPMQEAKSGCGNKIGIVGSSKPMAKTRKYNAWCYKE